MFNSEPTIQKTKGARRKLSLINKYLVFGVVKLIFFCIIDILSDVSGLAFIK